MIASEALATFYAAVIQGMSTQAVDGADRSTLENVADLPWPSFRSDPNRSHNRHLSLGRLVAT